MRLSVIFALNGGNVEKFFMACGFFLTTLSGFLLVSEFGGCGFGTGVGHRAWIDSFFGCCYPQCIGCACVPTTLLCIVVPHSILFIWFNASCLSLWYWQHETDELVAAKDVWYEPRMAYHGLWLVVLCCELGGAILGRFVLLPARDRVTPSPIELWAMRTGIDVGGPSTHGGVSGAQVVGLPQGAIVWGQQHQPPNNWGSTSSSVAQAPAIVQAQELQVFQGAALHTSKKIEDLP